MSTPIIEHKLFIFYGDDESYLLTQAVIAELWITSVQITPVLFSQIYEIRNYFSQVDVIGGVLLISQQALHDPNFGDSVQICVKTISSRPEFRLFVFPIGLTESEWNALKITNSTIADLCDVIQLPDTLTVTPQTIVVAIRAHLAELPAIKRWLVLQRLKKVGGIFAHMLSILIALSIFIVVFYWAYYPINGGSTPWFPWIMFLHGIIFYMSGFMLLTLGASVQVPVFLRALLATSFPVWFYKNISFQQIEQTWKYLLAGFLLALINDNYRRLWVQNKKNSIPLSIAQDDMDLNLRRLSGIKYWNFLTNSAIFGVRPRVFISYARMSQWGTLTATQIKHELDKFKILAFLDVHDMPAGCSWHHQMKKGLFRSTVFISIQDEVALSRSWVGAELAAANAGQWYSGNPVILVVRKNGLADQPASRMINPALNPIIFPERNVDPSLLQIIDYKDSTPVNIARGLLRYQIEHTLFAPYLSQLVWFLVNIVHGVLFIIGWIGGLLVLPGILLLVYNNLEFPIFEWVQANDFLFESSMLLTFWAGFCFRYLVWLNFEMETEKGRGCAFNFNIGFLYYSAYWWAWSMNLDALQAVYSFLFFNIGFLTAENSIDFISYGEQRKNINT